MARKTQSPTNQTATGDGNIQVAGDQNTVSVHQTFVQKVIHDLRGETEQESALRNRRAMLELVRNTWVKGVLEQSLYKEVLIKLGLEARPGAVEHPWGMQLQLPDQPNRRLPPNTSIIDIFDEMNGSMLILGEPGSGKTTMLLELARDSITRAEEDDTRPIPVVFNLSSWVDRRKSIDNWLVEELTSPKYKVPPKLAQSWVVNDQLHLLLDGLDEVKSENREACVTAINDFLRRHGLTVPVVVCSRVAEYTALKTKLDLAGGVLLEPLTPQQIDEYFEEAGAELEAVRQTMQADTVLQELVRQPLMLSILTLAYRGTTTEMAVDENLVTLESRRRQLFDAYIQRVFAGTTRTKIERFTLEQTKRWLAWLAKELLEEGQSIVLLERMRRSWLNSPVQRRMHRSFAVLPALLIGVLFGFGLFQFGISVAVIIGVGMGIITFLIFADEKPVETTKWSWRTFLKHTPKDWLAALVGGIFVGGVFGIFVDPIGGLVAGISGLLGAVIILGFGISEIEEKTKVNQAIILSMRNALIFGLIPTIIVMLVGNLAAGLGIGLYFGFSFGGTAVINHYFLRFLLYCNGYMPLSYVRFLDFCVDRILLRKVGGGYIFVHRLLMEHFAAMYPADEK